MIRFFLNRPIFATVCALMITLAGAVMIPTLPIAQYPQVARMPSPRHCVPPRRGCARYS
ncbi:MAG: efflux RND transporter permease subunit [Candidatus Tyrphobacter sp.]